MNVRFQLRRYKTFFIEETENRNSGAKTMMKKRHKIRAPHGCWIRDDEKAVPKKYEPIFVFQKLPTRHKKQGSNEVACGTTSSIQPMDFASAISKLAIEFDSAINEPRINPIRLRALYAALEKIAAGKEQSIFFRGFNKIKRNDYFLTETAASGLKSTVPQFVQRKTANRSSKKLTGKNVLVQILKANGRGNTERFFAYAEVLPPQFGDDPKVVWVKIADNKKYAERLCGLTIKVRRWDILDVAHTPSPFLYKEGKWSY